MCGIAGAIDFNERPKVEECLSGMLASMRRRGPDAAGIDISDAGILFHSRLIVIDPVNGGQPMKLRRGDEVYTIVYNGELYNTEELRLELMAAGDTFKGHSDTEVLLAAYARWGEACLERLNGIYAFAVLHERARKLFVARDRMGVKPFFYAQVGSTFVFASEIKTILKYPGVEPVIDSRGVTELLLIGPGRTPGCGVFRDIHELRPGEYGIFESRHLECSDNADTAGAPSSLTAVTGCKSAFFEKHRYWMLRDHSHTDTPEQTVRRVRALVTDAIRRQLVSDVPVGAFLSGGLDSSLISSVAASYMRERGERLKTFSVTYRNNRKYFRTSRFQPTTDDDFIGVMTEYLGSEHHTFTIDNEDLARALYAATDARDLPGMADVDSSLLLFCEEIKRHVTVALSGECADEIFGGYPWYRDKNIRAAYGFPWAQSTAMRAGFLAPDLARRMSDIFDFSNDSTQNNTVMHPSASGVAAENDSALSDAVRKWAESCVNERYENTLRETDILPGLSEDEKRLREMVRLNTDWFMETLLDRKDRMSMYSGLEVRVPFCDHRIAEYMYSVPWELKEMGGMEKGLLREAAAGLLPDAIRLRKKSPYPKTHDPGYRAVVSSMLSDIINDNDAPVYSLISRSALQALLDDEFTEPWYGQLMTGPQTMAYMIQLNYWLDRYNVRISL